jgi:hypothetical protein
MRTRHNVMLYIHCLSFYIPVFYLLFMKVYYEQIVPVYGGFSRISLYTCITAGYVLLEGIFPQSRILFPSSEAKAAGT